MRKPRKVKNILFTAIHDRDFHVYSDLSKEQLEVIPGVVFVFSKTSSAYEVTTSPLYDIKEIMKYIEWLAEEKQCECECECDCEPETFTVYCRIPASDLRRIPGIEFVRSHTIMGAHRHITVKAGCNVGTIKNYVYWLMNKWRLGDRDRSNRRQR